MIEVKTKLGKTEVNISGSLAMLCTDTVQIVRAVYNAIKKRDEDVAESYKKMMTDSLCKMAFKKDGETPEIDGLINVLSKLVKLLDDNDDDKEDENDD